MKDVSECFLVSNENGNATSSCLSLARTLPHDPKITGRLGNVLFLCAQEEEMGLISTWSVSDVAHNAFFTTKKDLGV